MMIPNGDRPAPPLRVASWPGRTLHNPFIEEFLDGLRGQGCEVEGLASADEVGRVSCDVLLLHWLELIYAEGPGKLALVKRMMRLTRALERLPRETTVVWVAHNLGPHERGHISLKTLLWGPYRDRVLKRVDGVLALSPGTVEPVRRAFPALAGRPVGWCWHLAYRDVVLTREERAAARARHGWDDSVKVIGFCGQIRPYKGLDELVDSFRGTDRADFRLLISGRPHSQEHAERLARVAESDQRITLELKILPAEDFRANVGACDLLAVPIVDYLHSGSLIYALSAHRPVLTRLTPFSGSLRDEVGRDWVRTYDGALDTERLVAAADEGTPAGEPDLTDLAADRVAERALRFFHTLRRSDQRAEAAAPSGASAFARQPRTGRADGPPGAHRLASHSRHVLARRSHH